MKTCLLLSVALVAGCNGGVSGATKDDAAVGSGLDAGIDAQDQWDQALAARTVDYNAALRSASLKLTGHLPKLTDIQAIAGEPDTASKKTAYEALIDQYLASPDFGNQMFRYWQNTLKMGDSPLLDSAAGFAASVAINNDSYMQLFTATTGTCGTFDTSNGTYTSANCSNGVTTQAGLLSHPGMNSQFFSNFAFRRVRWVQETFVCTKFPAEIAATPTDVGGASPYTGVYPFTSIPNLTTGRINFQDTSAVICADCHSTMNHIAPLFANFDGSGQYQTAMAVPTPLTNNPLAQLTDYLAAGEQTSWRFGTPSPDLPSLGAAMAADPDIAACGVARMMNFAFDKGDIVDSLEQVPQSVMQSTIDTFAADGYKLKDLVRAIFVSDDFTKF